jgi:inosose dehydratase
VHLRSVAPEIRAKVLAEDLYPVEPHIPLPIGARAAGYYEGCGLRPVRRWPC